MNKRNLVALAILLSLLGGMGYYVYSNVEHYTRQVNTGPALDVAVNPWYAAQQFLKLHNIESHRAMDLNAMLHRLHTTDALVLFNDTPIYDAAQQQKLLDWMRDGGHLILAANYEWDADENTSDDPFLDDMGVRLIYIGEEDDEDAESDTEDAGESENEIRTQETDSDPSASHSSEIAPDTRDPSAENIQSTQDEPPQTTPACSIYASSDIYSIHYRDDAAPLHINFGYTYTLEDANKTAVRSANAEPNGLLEYAVGKGRMTVLLDTDIWNTRNIGDFDHAFLLWHLVNDSPTVWMVASHDSENLLALLWRTARYLLIGIVVMLLLWGWHRWVRFGPLIPDAIPARRQLLEHIEASTLFSWTHQQTAPLLQIVRDDIWFHLNRHHGVNHNEGDAETAAFNKLAELSQLPPDMIQLAMTCAPPLREANWIELISQLQTIRNAL